MLLVVDVGNTNTVIGVYSWDSLQIGAKGEARTADFGLSHHFRIATVTERTVDEYALLLVQLLGMRKLDHLETIKAVALSSTVPQVTQTMRDVASKWFGVTPVVVGPGVKSGIPILYDNAKEVGADRICDAIAGLDLYSAPLVVVDYGTATTFDVLSAKGEYLGGAICPGIEISLNALVSRAAALRNVELTPPRSVIGKSTVESIQSGVLYGFAAQTDGMVERIRDEIGEDLHVIATGGLAPLVAPFSKTIKSIEPWLTLHGLRLVYERNL